MIEKDFTIVHYCDVKMKDNKRNYILELQSDGKNSAKTPPMFLDDNQDTMENDYAVFLEKMKTKLKE